MKTFIDHILYTPCHYNNSSIVYQPLGGVPETFLGRCDVRQGSAHHSFTMVCLHPVQECVDQGCDSVLQFQVWFGRVGFPFAAFFECHPGVEGYRAGGTSLGEYRHLL